MYDVSIIMPIYNVESYLEEAILSLVNQNPFNYEIILVDDGSTDSCNQICMKYSNLENVTVIRKENGGLASARKTGLYASNGRYIAFLDGDDWVDKDYYYAMYTKAAETDADVVCSSFVFNFAGGIRKTVNVVEDGFYSGEDLEELRKNMIYTKPYYTFGIAPSLCMKLIKRELMEKYLLVVPNNITLAEDASCSFPMMYNCESIYILHSNVGYHYRQIVQSMTRRYDPAKMDKVNTAIKYFDNAMSNKYGLYKEQIDMFLGTLVRDLISNEIKSDCKIKTIAKNLKEFGQNDIVERTIQNQRNLPLLYSCEFELYKRKKYITLIGMLKLFQKIRGKQL